MNSGEIVLTHPDSERVVADAKQRLHEADLTAMPSVVDKARALQELADQLLAMRAKGFTQPRLATILMQSGLDVSAEDLDEFLRRELLTRVLACDDTLPEMGRQQRLAKTQRALWIERELRRAVATGDGLALHYQPQVDMATGAIVGAEALLRWQHVDGQINPAEFIPVAEACGLIVDLGDWVLREAAAEAAHWRHLGLGGESGIRLSVNLSVKQFSDDLPQRIDSALQAVGLDKALLGLEITESFLADDGSWLLLQGLHEAGFHLAIDDFGTGYSCLSRINTLPLDTIKIDRSFVVDLGKSAGAAVVVEAVIDLAHNLGMSIIAEGVETEFQRDLLMELGCEIAQGFLFARPIAGPAFVELALSAESRRTDDGAVNR
jgi:EAL domain-containing protein (putative c-di-GMP-specific phosphodiesterase class I)